MMKYHRDENIRASKEIRNFNLLRTIAVAGSTSSEYLAYAQATLKGIQERLIGEIYDTPINEQAVPTISKEDKDALEAKKAFLEYSTTTSKGFSSLGDIMASFSKVGTIVNS